MRWNWSPEPPFERPNIVSAARTFWGAVALFAICLYLSYEAATGSVVSTPRAEGPRERVAAVERLNSPPARPEPFVVYLACGFEDARQARVFETPLPASSVILRLDQSDAEMRAIFR